MAKGKKVTNGGSAIGEAIGDLLEAQAQATLKEIESESNIRFLTSLGKTKKGTESKKLLLPDDFGNKYNMDGVVISEEGYPLVLLESKYVRYTKHNRDKASWICNAHTAVRRHFPSIMTSVAVLAGNWSSSSLAMLESYGISCFIIPFQAVSDILSRYGIDFKWEENDDEKALRAWNAFLRLTADQKKEIGTAMIDIVKADLIKFVKDVLNDTSARKVKGIVAEIRSSKGETFTYKFDSMDKAVEFLENFNDNFDESQFRSIY